MTTKLKWKNTGKTFRMAHGRIIKPNEVFEALESEIPKGFRDIIVPAQPIPPESALQVTGSGYQLRHRGSNWYDILDGQGKVVNEKALRHDEARSMLESLAPGQPIKEVPAEPKKTTPWPEGAQEE